MKKKYIIAVDFDGTIVEDRYPKIGKPFPFAFETLRLLQRDGHRVILWTYRSGEKLQEAIDFLHKSGITPYSVNSSYPEERFDESQASRKINADIFIDDRNLGGFPGWGVVYQKLSGGIPPEARKSWVRRLLEAWG